MLANRAFLPDAMHQMDVKRLRAQLERDHAGRSIIERPERYPTELLCVIEEDEDHQTAVGFIEEVAPHSHEKSTETYTVLQGRLILVRDGIIRLLRPGIAINILPGTIHSAEAGYSSHGHVALVRVVSRPPLDPEDYVVAEATSVTDAPAERPPESEAV